MRLRRPNRRKEAGRPLYESRAFSNFYIRAKGGYVSGATVIGANFMAPPSLPRVRAYSQNTLAVSPPLVSEIFSAPPGFFKFKR